MTRKKYKKEPLSITPGIDWQEEKKPAARSNRKRKPTPTQRLATLSDLAAHLGQSDEPGTLADIETLQMLARGEDLDIDSLEI